MPDSLLPNTPGTYALIFVVEALLTIHAGKLGAVTLPPGPVIYTGSALGPGGLRARVGRHLRQEKKPHWHIDALTAVLPVAEVWMVQRHERLECAWAAALRTLPGAAIPAVGFGASDCACPAHLISVSDLAAARAALDSGWGPLIVTR